MTKEPNYFSVVSHPETFKEIKEMAYQLSKVPGSFKYEILTSFLRNRSINDRWLSGNDALVQAITSGSLKTANTERLFESGRNNEAFMADLEGCIQTELIDCQSHANQVNVDTSLPHVGSFQDQCYYAFVATSAAGTQMLTGIHEEDPSNQIEWKIVDVLEIKKRMRRIVRSLFSTSAPVSFS